MITTVNNSAEMRQALNENLSGLLTGKRKPLMVKEVNNTLGKLLCEVKMEIQQNMLCGNRNRISWFDSPSSVEWIGDVPRVENTYSTPKQKFKKYSDLKPMKPLTAPLKKLAK